MQPSFGTLRSSWRGGTIAILAAIYIAINLFHIGSDEFIINLNNFIVVPLALTVAIMAMSLLHSTGVGSLNRVLWGGWAGGLTLWTIAELWWAIAGMIGQEVPYPSGADVLWLAGYIAIYVGLWGRVRRLPRIAGPSRNVPAIIISLFVLAAVTVLIFVPMIQSSEPAPFVESALNFLYPLADVVMLILILSIFVIYEQGVHGQAWAWLSAGFVFFALGDLAFVYTNMVGSYYPDQKVNLASSLVDMVYNTSYVLLLVGLLRWPRMAAAGRKTAGADSRLALVPNTHVLVFTGDDHIVTSVSGNYSRVFPQGEGVGKTLAEVLGVPHEVAEELVKELYTKSLLTERECQVTTNRGKEKAWISGIPYSSRRERYDGVLLALRLFTMDSSLDKLLTGYQKSMVSSIMGKTGAEQAESAEIRRLLGEYYQGFFSAVHHRVVFEGGSAGGEALLNELRGVINLHGWHINILPEARLDLRSASLPEVQEGLPALLEAAKGFLDKIADESIAESVVGAVRRAYGEAVVKNVSSFAPA